VVIVGVMTAESIGAAKGGGYARYLESKTVEPELGAYYLTPEGEPQQPAGQWLASPDTLARLGIEGDGIDGADFAAPAGSRRSGARSRQARWTSRPRRTPRPEISQQSQREGQQDPIDRRVRM
jgi:hypothetical protein